VRKSNVNRYFCSIFTPKAMSMAQANVLIGFALHTIPQGWERLLGTATLLE
jgi:hypothetical protein